MFFILSKFVYWLVMPISLLAWLVIASFFMKRKKYKRITYTIVFSLFLFFTNPFIANVMINTWESDAIPYAELESKYTYGIVLSGITNPDRPPFDRVQFNKGADRIVHALDLYRQGIIAKIVITGGSGKLLTEGKKESHVLRDFAVQNGIPKEDIIIEDQARNTHENALFAFSLIANSDESIILLTSAFHMPRAKRSFEKAGLSVVPFPTDHYGQEISFTPDQIVIPSLYGLEIWTILAKEWIGLLAYWAAGYI